MVSTIIEPLIMRNIQTGVHALRMLALFLMAGVGDSGDVDIDHLNIIINIIIGKE